MKVAFRTDASARIGSGHVARCVTLAKHLCARGAEVLFIVGEHQPGWYDRIERAGFSLHRLPRPPEPAGTVEDGDYAGWLGVSEFEDAEQTLAVIGDGVDLLVVDHYGLGATWERRLRSSASRIMAIDDLADREHDVDVLLDQNLAVDPVHRYAGLVSEGTTLLVGPRVALLDHTFAQLHAVVCRRPRSGPVTVVVYLGASDLFSLTLPVVRGLLGLGDGLARVEVVTRAGSVVRDELRALQTDDPRLGVWDNVASLAGLLAIADVAVGAGGVTALERLCLGVPTVLLSVAENQRPGCRSLDRYGTVSYVGDAADVDADTVVGEVVRLIHDPVARAEFSQRGQQLVDGLGALRVAEVLRPTPTADVAVVTTGGRCEIVAAGLTLTVFDVAEHEQADRFAVIESDPVVGERDVAGWALQAHRRRRQRAASSPSGAPSRKAPMQLDLVSTERCEAARRVTVVTDADSWINPTVEAKLGEWLRRGHTVDWVHRAEHGATADVCFYLSYGRIVKSDELARHRHNLVVHESELPRGRGWSPLTWQVLEGASQVAVTLFEAVEKLDAGPIYAQRWVTLEGHELIEELRRNQAEATLELCDWALQHFDLLGQQARAQRGRATFYPRRRPADSRLDPQRTIAEQFNLLRVVDSERYPAFFELRGRRYVLALYDGGVAEEPQP